MATNGSFTQQDQYKSAPEQYPATSGVADSTAGNSSGSSDLSKDEVGWYFVEQYYTTLSKSPEKLHLFYGKRSQFVSGLEAEVAPVSFGRSAIQERIRELDFQDCKVRVSNVDSQASFENIVIQVIGETSNKSAELKKFVQTFVLAQQPTGYFVLNDIFRYINEEGEEEAVDSAIQEESAATGPLLEDVEMPKAQATIEEPTPAALDTSVVDKKLETVEAESAAATNGTDESAAVAEETPATAAKVEEEIPTPEAAEKAVEEELREPEKPKDPLPSPAIARLPSTATKPTEPAQPAAPPKPLSWAGRAAAALGSAPKPAVPAVTPKTSTPPAQARVAPAAKPAPTQSTPAATASNEKEKENAAPGAGWQTAGDHAKRQNRPQSISTPPEKEGTMAYIRNVTEKLSPEELRSALESFGQLIYFDINRGKNCAFVEYATPEGYNAAASANPHQIAGEAIYVEPRRPKANAYGGNGYTGRGGVNNTRGRGGFQDNRQGNQGQGGRGNFGANRGRGGRGTGQAANA